MPLIRKEPKAIIPPTPGSSELVAQLTAGEPDQRWAAARALADQAGGAGPLAAALANESDARVREAILTGLVRHPGDFSVSAILPLVRSDDASVRTAAMDSLRAMPAALAARLGQELSDPDPDVRLLLCDLVRVLPDGEASRMLCVLIDQETEINVCASAVDVLAEIGGPEALPSLERCAARFAAEPFLSFSIRAALQRISASLSDRRG